MHPFYIKSIHEKEELDLIGIHNGVISNLYRLGTTYDLKSSDWAVDSQGLYMLIDKVGLEILKEYEGKAALLWCVKGEPNAVYAYHGMYKEYIDDADDKVWEERPLWYLETAEGIYFSSLENSLLSIAEEKQVPKIYIYNEVHEVKNGKWTKFKYEVDRVNGPNTKKRTTVWQGNRQQGWKDDGDDNGYSYMNRNTEFYATHHWDNITKTYIPNAEVVNATTVVTENKVWQEQLPLQYLDKSEKEDRIYFWKGRFHFNNRDLVHGVVSLDKKGFRAPVTSLSSNMFYFWNGVMLKGEKSFLDLVAEDAKLLAVTKDKTVCFARYISTFSLYPVTTYPGESMTQNDVVRSAWYEGGVRVHKTISISTKFSSRHYQIDKEGNLISITSSDRKDKDIWMTVETGNNNTPEESIFDTIFLSEKEAFDSLTQTEMDACVAYCKDYLDKKSKVNITIEDAEHEFLNELLESISKGVSLRTQLEDSAHGLEEFVKKQKTAFKIVTLKLDDPKRYTAWREKGNGKKEHRVGWAWDTVDNCWVTQAFLQKIIDHKNGKETHGDVFVGPVEVSGTGDTLIDGSFITDETIKISYYDQQGNPYTEEGEEVLMDSDGYDYIVRDNQKVYIFNDESDRRGEIKLTEEDKEELQKIEQDEIVTTWKDIIEQLGDINNRAEELGEKTDSLIAQELSIRIGRLIDNIKHGFAEVGEQFGLKEVVELTNRTLNSKLIM